jgi:hypothetical protein
MHYNINDYETAKIKTQLYAKYIGLNIWWRRC